MPCADYAHLFKTLCIEWFNATHSYTHNDIVPLWEFQETWRKPEYEFLDAEIEQKREALYKSVARVTEALSLECYSEDVGPKISLPKERAVYNPEYYNKALSTIETAIEDVLKDHKELVSTARRILKC